MWGYQVAFSSALEQQVTGSCPEEAEVIFYLSETAQAKIKNYREVS